MKAIVFGGAGFLGSHVADALTRHGHNVTIFDLHPSPYLQPRQRMEVGDIRDRGTVERAVRGHSIVYNFAGFSDIEASAFHPLDTIESNVLGNGIILESCRRWNVRRYVFASTVYVYSQAGSFYRASKRACEDYIECYEKVFGIPFTLLRFGSLYGPRADHRNGIYRLVKAALEKGRIVYPGDGEELREYIHVLDAAESSVDILSKEFKNQCVVLSGSQPTRSKDLLILIQEILGRRIPIQFRIPRDNPTRLHYRLTPYSFVPREAKKLFPRSVTDLGQGLLGLISELHGGLNVSKKRTKVRFKRFRA